MSDKFAHAPARRLVALRVGRSRGRLLRAWARLRFIVVVACGHSAFLDNIVRHIVGALCFAPWPSIVGVCVCVREWTLQMNPLLVSGAVVSQEHQVHHIAS